MSGLLFEDSNWLDDLAKPCALTAMPLYKICIIGHNVGARNNGSLAQRIRDRLRAVSELMPGLQRFLRLREALSARFRQRETLSYIISYGCYGGLTLTVPKHLVLGHLEP